MSSGFRNSKRGERSLSVETDSAQDRIRDPDGAKTVVAIFAPLFPPAYKGGGPIRSIDALVSNAPRTFETFVLTNDRDHGAREQLPVVPNVWSDREGYRVYYATASKLLALIRGFRSLRRKNPELLYINGFFDPRFSILPQLLWRCGYWRGASRLLAPRGEFGEGALSRRPFKKRLYIAAYRLLGLHHSVVWHATAEHEAVDIRRQWGPEARVIVRPNDTALPSRATAPKSTTETLRAVFLGRIVEHKGLAVALRALREVPESLTFDVYGFQEDPTYLQHCKALAEKLPGHIRVAFHGPLSQDKVRHTLADYDALIMPTRGENFGHVLAEALSVSCIVVTGPYTPWTDLLKAGGGVVVKDRSPAEWGKVITGLASLPRQERAQKRDAARLAYERWAGRPSLAHVFELLAHPGNPNESGQHSD
jgi:glycosyltransferase involved in cell wall biosynthesis